MFGGLLRSDLLQLLALPFDVRGDARLWLGVSAPLLRFLLPQHLGHGRADQVFDGVAFGRGLAVVLAARQQIGRGAAQDVRDL